MQRSKLITIASAVVVIAMLCTMAMPLMHTEKTDAAVTPEVIGDDALSGDVQTLTPTDSSMFGDLRDSLRSIIDYAKSIAKNSNLGKSSVASISTGTVSLDNTVTVSSGEALILGGSGVTSLTLIENGGNHGNYVFKDGSTLAIDGAFTMSGTGKVVITLEEGSKISVYGVVLLVPKDNNGITETVSMTLDKTVELKVSGTASKSTEGLYSITNGKVTIDLAKDGAFSIAHTYVSSGSTNTSTIKIVGGSDSEFIANVNATFTEKALKDIKVLMDDDSTSSERAAAKADLKTEYAKCNANISVSGSLASLAIDDKAKVNSLAYSFSFVYSIPTKSTDNCLAVSTSASFSADSNARITGSGNYSLTASVNAGSFIDYMKDYSAIPSISVSGSAALNLKASNEDGTETFTVTNIKAAISASFNRNTHILKVDDLSLSADKFSWIDTGNSNTTKDDQEVTINAVSASLVGNINLSSFFSTGQPPIEVLPDANATLKVGASSVYVKDLAYSDANKTSIVTVNINNFSLTAVANTGVNAPTGFTAALNVSVSGSGDYSYVTTDNNGVVMDSKKIAISDAKINLEVDTYTLLNLIRTIMHKSVSNDTVIKGIASISVGSVSVETFSHYVNTTSTTTTTDDYTNKIDIKSISAKVGLAALIYSSSGKVAIGISDGSGAPGVITVGSVSYTNTENNKFVDNNNAALNSTSDNSTGISMSSISISAKGEVDIENGSLSSITVSSASLKGNGSYDYSYIYKVDNKIKSNDTRKLEINGVDIALSAVKITMGTMPSSQLDQTGDPVGNGSHVIVSGRIDASVSSVSYVSSDIDGDGINASLKGLETDLTIDGATNLRSLFGSITDGSYVKVSSFSFKLVDEGNIVSVTTTNLSATCSKDVISDNFIVKADNLGFDLTRSSGPLDTMSLKVNGLEACIDYRYIDIHGFEPKAISYISASSLSIKATPIGYGTETLTAANVIFKFDVEPNENDPIIVISSGTVTMNDFRTDRLNTKTLAMIIFHGNDFGVRVSSGATLKLENNNTLYFLIADSGSNVSGTLVFTKEYNEYADNFLTYNGTKYNFDSNSDNVSIVATLNNALSMTIMPAEGYSKIAPRTTASDVDFTVNTDGTATAIIVSDAGYQKLLVNCTDAKTYQFTYGSHAAVSKHFGDSITLTAPTAPTGYSFIGWFDGMELYDDGTTEYIMPARDVVMNEVFAKVYNDISVVPVLNAAKDAFVVSADGTTSQITLSAAYVDFLYGKMGTPGYENVKYLEFTYANGTTVRIDKSTVDGFRPNGIVVYVINVTSFEKQSVTNVVGSSPVLRIVITDGLGSTISTFSSGVTVTLRYTLNAGESADQIKVNYLDSNGHLTRYDTTWKKSDTAGVIYLTFSTDHLSDWTPMKYVPASSGGSSSDNTLLYVGIGIAAVIVLAGAGFFLIKKRF